MFLLFGYTLRDYLCWYHTPSWSFPTSTGVILLTAKRCAALAFAHGIARASISISLIMLTSWPITGGSQDDGYSGCKVGKVRDD